MDLSSMKEIFFDFLCFLGTINGGGHLKTPISVNQFLETDIPTAAVNGDQQ
jgi:hypothetical protein